MREIKFRAWYDSPLKPQMIYPEKSNIITSNGDLINTTSINNVVLIKMQFTGLKDKNGVDIYEGDIVMAKVTIEVKDGGEFCYFSTKDNVRKKYNCKPKPSIVEWSKSGFLFKVPTGETQPFWVCIKNIEEEYEVIGNIHENK